MLAEHTGRVSDVGWQWNPSLYLGSAAYYVQGRVPYPQELADRLAAELMLDGSGRLLDIGCGPGSLTLLLAGLFEHARFIRGALFPVTDPAGSVDDALALVRAA